MVEMGIDALNDEDTLQLMNIEKQINSVPYFSQVQNSRNTTSPRGSLSQPTKLNTSESAPPREFRTNQSYKSRVEDKGLAQNTRKSIDYK